MAVLSLITWYMLDKTVLGRHMAATGGNKQAAIVSGINVKKTQLMAYVYSGALAAIAGMVMTARIKSGQLSTGDGFEMDAIAGAVIGGASMAGGMGTVLGAICGTLVISTMKNGMDLLSLNAYWQQVAQGAIIILAVLLDIGRKRLRQ
jgi:ribose/xylose/arabinose/galactoside ABC-type transport system permease subunit